VLLVPASRLSITSLRLGDEAIQKVRDKALGKACDKRPNQQLGELHPIGRRVPELTEKRAVTALCYIGE